MDRPALEHALEKQAFLGNFARNLLNPQNAKTLESLAKAAPVIGAGAYLSAMVVKNGIQRIQNDTRRRAVIDDLMAHDPLISQADKAKVMEFYATIYNVAPTVSLDKNAVRELLHGFLTFGRVPLETLKTLAETEKAMATNQREAFSLKNFI